MIFAVQPLTRRHDANRRHVLKQRGYVGSRLRAKLGKRVVQERWHTCRKLSWCVRASLVPI